MRFIFTFLVTILQLLTLPIAGANNSEDWLLMSRHGECAEIGALQRKIPDIGDIDNPQAFVKFMQSKGYEVIVSAMKNIHVDALQVTVPEKSLGLIFVKGSVCKGFINS